MPALVAPEQPHEGIVGVAQAAVFTLVAERQRLDGQFAEARAEGHLLLVGKVLAREDQHGVFVEGGLHGVPLVCGQIAESRDP